MATMIESCSLISRSRKENLKDDSEEIKCPDFPYIYIEKEDDIQSAIDEINVAIEEKPMIAVDCEGVDLSRKGQLTILSIATRGKVYIFDILKLNGLVFDKGLRSILENKSIHTLMYDCREDADILQHLFHVEIDGILDIQLLEIMNRDPETSHVKTKRSERHDEVMYLKGLLRSLDEYVKHQSIVSKKRKVALQMNQDREVWKKRPLSSDMLSYAIVDVSSLYLLFDHFNPDEDEMNRLLLASEQYVNFQRSKQIRSYDEFEINKFLPIDIIPKKGSTFIETGYTNCTTCKRCFPRDEFSKNQLTLSTQKCRTCKRVKHDADVKANREDNYERQQQLYRQNDLQRRMRAMQDEIEDAEDDHFITFDEYLLQRLVASSLYENSYNSDHEFGYDHYDD